MLNDLLTTLRINFSNEVPLGSIPDTACPTSTLPVFDFDMIKDKFCSVLKLSDQLKSVDALYCSTTSDKILLIEMKRYSTSAATSTQDFVDHHLKDEEVPHKVMDSIILLLSICGYYAVNRNIYSYLLERKPPKIKSILLVDFTDREYINYVAVNSPQRNISFTKRIDAISILNCKNFHLYIGSL